MKLPALTNWEATAHSLHKAAQLLGGIRTLFIDPVPNYLELAMAIKPEGLSTGPMPFGGEVILNFRQAAMVYEPEAGRPVAVSLAGHSQVSLFEAVLAALAANGKTLAPKTDQHRSLIDAFLDALLARGHRPQPKRERFTSEAPLEIVPQLAADYADALYRIFTATARFRARLTGPMTPIVVWPGHFDLSTLWFATDNATESGPQMNFGFAPFSEGIPRPYLYTTAWPLPAGFGAPATVPPLAYWNTTGWTGMVVPYDELVKVDDPEAFIEETFAAIYKALAPVLRDSRK